MSKSAFATLTEIGKIYGVSAQFVGRWLKNMGLRREDGRPSTDALKQGFVLERPLDHGGFFYLWHEAKTTHELDMMGYPRGGVSPYIEIADGCVIIRGGC